MNFILFGNRQPTYRIALMIKDSYFNQDMLRKFYIDPLVKLGYSEEQIIAIRLPYSMGKFNSKLALEYLADITEDLKDLQIEYIICADAKYFPKMTKERIAEPSLGYLKPCTIKGLETVQVAYTMNYGACIHNPEQLPKIRLSLNCLAQTDAGTHTVLGSDIIHFEEYPSTYSEIQTWLAKLSTYPALTVDIEAFNLSLRDAQIGTIAFAWNKHEGIAFAVDYSSIVDAQPMFGEFIRNQAIRNLLRDFFQSYEGNLKFHNANFDCRNLVMHLFMKNPMDSVGKIDGIKVFTRNMDDTMMVAYLATNSTGESPIGLKALAHEFAGNWAVDEINDIRRIELPKLLRYNLVDCLSTWYVWEKYYPIMIQDNQEKIYKELFMPSVKYIMQMELTGLPINMKRVKEVEILLNNDKQVALNTLMNNPFIKETVYLLKERYVEQKHKEWKKKRITVDEVSLDFNPNSDIHVRALLHDILGLPVIDLTDGGQPSTAKDTLAKLVHHCKSPNEKGILQALTDFADVEKVISSFLPAFLDAYEKDGWHYLHGSFRMGGTLSGRMSSSTPNLQNLPAGSRYGDLIKSCVQAKTGKLYVGADFNALEDKVNTLLTRDPNKMKIFLEGFDGHCLRAYFYFKEQMPLILDDSVKSINSIKKLYDALRSQSKAPSFAMQYLGTASTLMKNCGFSKDLADTVYKRYQEMYKISVDWMNSKINLAAKQGYIDLAFGLRLRTPLLKQSILGARSTLKAATAESRTVGNAVGGQSYCLLNNRALNAFMDKVWDSEYIYDIDPTAAIHDANYFSITDNLDVLKWVNDNLIKEMEWQDLPEIQHDQIKLGGELDVFYPSWENKITLPNNASIQEIIHTLSK